jgi:hypothetical protein
MYFCQKLKNKIFVKKIFFNLKTLFLKHNFKYAFKILNNKAKVTIFQLSNATLYIYLSYLFYTN